jgi:hypothetical protein
MRRYVELFARARPGRLSGERRTLVTGGFGASAQAHPILIRSVTRAMPIDQGRDPAPWYVAALRPAAGVRIPQVLAGPWATPAVRRVDPALGRRIDPLLDRSIDRSVGRRIEMNPRLRPRVSRLDRRANPVRRCGQAASRSVRPAVNRVSRVNHRAGQVGRSGRQAISRFCRRPGSRISQVSRVSQAGRGARMGSRTSSVQPASRAGPAPHQINTVVPAVTPARPTGPAACCPEPLPAMPPSSRLIRAASHRAGTPRIPAMVGVRPTPDHAGSSTTHAGDAPAGPAGCRRGS